MPWLDSITSTNNKPKKEPQHYKCGTKFHKGIKKLIRNVFALRSIINAAVQIPIPISVYWKLLYHLL